MVNVQPLDASNTNYSAVKIRVNDARTYNFNDTNANNGVYNAADIEVNRPSVYTYPDAKELITYKMAQIAPVEVPKSLPVPEPNVTTTEAEKELSFHGLNFKAAPQKPEIVPPVEIKPDVDVQAIEENLSSSDYDVQAQQLHDIVKAAGSKKDGAKDFVAPEIFESLINIIKKDPNGLEKPSQAQNEARQKLRENLIAVDKAFAEGVDPKEFKMPHDMTEEETQLALKLTPFEQVERNKTYALAVTALLAKAYADGVEAQTGNVVPLTDLPGASAMVDVLRKENNPDVKMTALDSLRYIARPEYRDELVTIFLLAGQDKDRQVAQYAAVLSLTFQEFYTDSKQAA